MFVQVVQARLQQGFLLVCERRSLNAVQHIPPRLAALAIALELGQRLVQELLLLRSRAKLMQEVALLKFAEPLEDLRSFFGSELGQFGKGFGFAHDESLLLAGWGGKHPLDRCDFADDHHFKLPQPV